jgi:hypothetical protein
MLKTRTIVRREGDARLMVAVADAHAAADAASRIAADATAWAARMGAGADDAVEASSCAVRARLTAEKASHCTTVTDAWSCARLGWAIVASAREASERVNVAIADWLTVA